MSKLNTDMKKERTEILLQFLIFMIAIALKAIYFTIFLIDD